MEDFAESAVGFSGDFIKAVFFGVENQIVGAGIGDRVAVERFFESCETGPRVVFRCAVGGDAPKIEFFETFGFCVQNKLNGQNTGGVHAAKIFVLSTLEVVASFGVVENETGGDNLVSGGGFLRGFAWGGIIRLVIFYEV